MRLAWVAVAAVVCYGVGRHVGRLWGELGEFRFHFSLRWCVVAGLSYGLGLSLCGSFWWLALRDMGCRAGRARTLAAYFVSQLGKYAPGKAWVVAIRCGMIAGPQANVLATAASVFCETLMMMAVGAAVALGIFLLVPTGQRWTLCGIAAGLAFGLWVGLLPPVFARLAQVATKPFRRAGQPAPPPCSGRSLAKGVGLNLGAWALLGLSLFATANAIRPAPLSLASWPLLTGTVALAIVGGFIIFFMPGGLGVREWVLMETLTPILGHEQAVLAALLLRFIWVLSEMCFAGACYAGVRIWSHVAGKRSS